MGAVSLASAVSRPEHRCATCGQRFPGDYALCPKDGTPLGASPGADDPLIGRVLGGSFRITRELARGGMGRLYEAEHTRLPRKLAVKIIHDVYAKHTDALARFEREARAAALVDSDHVVEVVDVVRADDDRPCIVCESLEGEDLQKRLDREGRVPIAEAITIARQMCRGLVAAHAAGVVHRDLKPSNVFLAARPSGTTVKLLDFGVAKLVGAPEITRTGAVVGTPAYMAPEQARGAASVDGRADVYGVGAVLFRMLTGHSPFEATDATASLARLLAEPIPRVHDFVPDVPAEVAELVEWAMAKDPLDRPDTPATLEARLSALDTATDEPLDLVEPPALTSGESTVVMPRGAVDGAVGEARALARARPRLGWLVVASALAVAAALASGLGATVRILRGAYAMAPVESALVSAAAVVIASFATSALAKRARETWSEPLALRTLSRRLERALGVGAATAGAVLVADAGVGALTRGGGAAPAAILLAAVLAGAFGALFASRR